MDDTIAIVLAAGKGKRMGLNGKNKVTCQIGGEPLIIKSLRLLNNSGLKNIIVVVGHAKNSVTNLLDNQIKTALQRKRLGTGHAVKVALKQLSKEYQHILVLYGDDSFLYTPTVLHQLFQHFTQTNPAFVFLTTEVDNPFGLGRILRDGQGKVIGIVEEKNASEEQRKIKEINSACYIFKKDFLTKYINKIPKNPLKGEYYLTDLVQIAVENHEPVEALNIKNLRWCGVNTPEELQKAEQLLNNLS